jgi:Leucine-rich repeat (LRR) protein
MRHSRLAGTLPVGLSKLSKLTTLSIQDSLVTGSLPDIMSMPNLETLQIEDSQISSILPGGWAWHKKIANILLARNRIYGNIPASWDAMTPLMNLDLNGNQLTGTIPAFYKTSISALQADDNRLTGPLPSTISPRIHKLSLINNMITGTIPSWNFGTEDGVLGVFRLRNNSLEGTIPNIFDQIKTWGTLDLSRNKLTGTIPPSITEGQLRFPQGGGMYLYKNNLSFCPAPRTVFISFLSDEFCDVGDQATKPPCSCVKIWSGGYCGPIDCIKGQ